VAETNGLLNRRTGKSGTEGSNPSVSATQSASHRHQGKTAQFCGSRHLGRYCKNALRRQNPPLLSHFLRCVQARYRLRDGAILRPPDAFKAANDRPTRNPDSKRLTGLIGEKDHASPGQEPLTPSDSAGPRPPRRSLGRHGTGLVLPLNRVDGSTEQSGSGRLDGLRRVPISGPSEEIRWTASSWRIDSLLATM
jgi:hypothetical protein